ncbi:MAG: KTSC domain-containing protein [Treponema sp.]|nr:KTSC domain-containing protein [Candidatus Treponema merdequi]
MLKFFDAIKNKFANKSKSKEAFDKLSQGQSFTYNPKSQRYTWENKEDSQYDKDWKPTTKKEKKSLSPEGYHRTGDRKSIREQLYNSVKNQVKEQIDDEQTADAAAKDIVDNQYHEDNISINSTALADVEYDPWNRIFGVHFQNNNEKYEYNQVPPEVVADFMRAPSKGEFFMRNIHDQYTLNPGHIPSNERQKKQYKNYFAQVRKVAAEARKRAKPIQK